jgi:curved DNA-binding protein CbpA
MEASGFTDYYEILEISPNANSDTIERIFRYLAMRYHPDNRDTGDARRFSEILEAHNALKEPVTRAQYDIQHKRRLQFDRKLTEEATDSKGIELDVDSQDKILWFLYIKRRQDGKEPGLSSFDLERLLGCPPDHLEFHVWYLKEKGWIRRQEDGMLAITAEGVDRAKSEPRREVAKLLTDQK